MLHTLKILYLTDIELLEMPLFLQNEAVLRACAETPTSQSSGAAASGVSEKDSTNSQ